MVATIGITDGIKSLRDLQLKLNLRQTEDESFFSEWCENLPELTDAEQTALDRVRQRYQYHREVGPLLEGTINLIVVSFLLELAGFLEPPFRIRSPESVEIAIEDPEEILKGLIDVLVVQEHLWVLVVESKRTSIPVPAAFPQILAYMMTNSTGDRPTYGAATNGDEIIFLKLSKTETPQYDVSDSFLLLPRRNRFYDVLRVLKRLGQLAIST
ncbi:type I restriction endonuclease subunit R [Lusitaniella coriacea]|uniref:type I restriction endonuclease subunit R n=1 Tax=Lusitaniella coriacea TaxID=1983105 RepID=UPI003CEA29BC